MQLKIKKLHPNAKIPTFGTDAAAGIVSIVCDIKQTQVNSSARRVRASS